MIFRGTLSNPPKAATRGKNISKRTYKKVKPNLNPIVFIDVTYIENILESKASHKLSKIYKIFNNIILVDAIKYNTVNNLSIDNKKAFYDLNRILYNIITNIVNKAKTNKVILVYDSKETLNTNINIKIILKLLLKPLNFQYVNLNNKYRFCDYIYTFCKEHSHNLSEFLLIYVTNSITTWACASTRLNHACILISRDDRAIIYNEKTGLDIVSRFIGTLHIINKLNLDECRNVNLQYLYVLIMFVRFLTEPKCIEEYFFDSAYYKQVKNISRKDFTGRNGKGYRLIEQANKTISYFFFTYEESLDKFLLLQSDDFNKYAMNLKKSIDFDLDLLMHFQRFYMIKDRLKLIQISKSELNIKPVVKPKTNSKDIIYNKMTEVLSRYNFNHKPVTILSENEMSCINKMLRELFR